MESRRRNPLRRYPTAVCISVLHFGLTQSKTRALNSPEGKGDVPVQKIVLFAWYCRQVGGRSSRRITGAIGCQRDCWNTPVTWARTYCVRGGAPSSSLSSSPPR
jgi:hypothetical protein